VVMAWVKKLTSFLYRNWENLRLVSFCDNRYSPAWHAIRRPLSHGFRHFSVVRFRLRMALQPGVGLGLCYNMPPGLSVPCSISPFVYTHVSQVHGHVIQPFHSWSSSSSCCIQLSVQHLFLGLLFLAFFLHDQAIVFFGI